MLLFTLILCSKASTPVIWSSNPVYPNETAILTIPWGGEVPSGDVLLCDAAGHCNTTVYVSIWERSVKFKLPDTLPTGIWSVRSSDGGAELARLNEADPWYTMCVNTGGGGSEAAVGVGGATPAVDPVQCYASTTLRVFGRSLGYVAAQQEGSSFECANISTAKVGAARVATVDHILYIFTFFLQLTSFPTPAPTHILVFLRKQRQRHTLFIPFVQIGGTHVCAAHP